MVPYEKIPKYRVEALKNRLELLDAENDMVGFSHELAFDNLMACSKRLEETRSRLARHPDCNATRQSVHEFECLLAKLAIDFAKARRNLASSDRKLTKLQRELEAAKKDQEEAARAKVPSLHPQSLGAVMQAAK